MPDAVLPTPAPAPASAAPAVSNATLTPTTMEALPGGRPADPAKPGSARAKMFETLAQEGVNIDMISTSEIKLSVVINLAKAEAAMKAVHRAFLG